MQQSMRPCVSVLFVLSHDLQHGVTLLEVSRMLVLRCDVTTACGFMQLKTFGVQRLWPEA